MNIQTFRATPKDTSTLLEKALVALYSVRAAAKHNIADGSFLTAEGF